MCLAGPCVSPKPIDLNKCILCQKRKQSEYHSSGEIGRGNIVSLAKQNQSIDARATRVSASVSVNIVPVSW